MNTEYNHYINSLFNFEGYVESLAKLVKDPKELTPERKLVKSQKLLTQIWATHAPKLIINSTDSGFIADVKEQVEKISLVKPGRKLLKQILKENSAVTIESDNNMAFFNRSKNTIGLNKDQFSFYFTLDSTNNICLIQHPRESTLFHELSHKIHPNEGADSRKLCPSPIPHMDNLEEQWAVTGIRPLDDQLDPISENAYLLALNYPCRISHRGFLLPCGSVLTHLDQLLAYADIDIQEVKKFVKIQNLKLNEKSLCHKKVLEDSSDKYSSSKLEAFNKQLYPLTAACYFGNKDLVNFFTEEQKVQLENDDDMGGPLNACFSANELELALEIIRRFNISSDDVVKSLVMNFKEKNSLKYNDKSFSSILSLLKPSDKFVLFKSLITQSDSTHILKILLKNCQGNERDAHNDTILTLTIKFFIQVKNKPLPYKYALLFYDILKLPLLKESLQITNSDNKDALSLALESGNIWLIEQVKGIESNLVQSEEPDNVNFHGLISNENWFDSLFEY